MFFKYRLYYFLLIFSDVAINFGNSYIRRNDHDKNYLPEDLSFKFESSTDKSATYNNKLVQKKQCWMRINSKKHFETMDKLDEKYDDVRKEYQDAAEKDNFDNEMIDLMVKTRGAAEREIQNAGGDTGLIPAGINLGGYFMMRMPKSLLFFHRMKLRNNTHFRIMKLRNDLENLTLNARLSLNDLHLQGSYDRANTDRDPSILYYTPTYGQVAILLKNVQYSMQGRYRLLKDRLTIELIISDINFDDVMLNYLNGTDNNSIRLQRQNIDDFLIHLKSDLDKWLKDYFNDYLMFFNVVGKGNNNKFQQYDKERAQELNSFMDLTIDAVIKKLQEVKAATVDLPNFTIFTANNMEILLKNGELRGLDSMYRRSIATGIKHLDVRQVDAVVGFSNLKVTYKYEALLATNSPLVSGMIILSSDELITYMGVTIAKDTEALDIAFEFMEQAKPESLTIEGSANRMISNFKYILEQHIIAIMTNTLHFNIKLLRTVTRCNPNLYGHQEKEEKENNYEENEETIADESQNILESTTPENIEDGRTDDSQFETSPATNTNRDISIEVLEPDPSGAKHIL